MEIFEVHLQKEKIGNIDKQIVSTFYAYDLHLDSVGSTSIRTIDVTKFVDRHVNKDMEVFKTLSSKIESTDLSDLFINYRSRYVISDYRTYHEIITDRG